MIFKIQLWTKIFINVQSCINFIFQYYNMINYFFIEVSIRFFELNELKKNI